ncbi:hypothetical protein HH308_17825 [Gordonia sp. TBRC 11910]|uniref:Uncharacterized protein n=1 Tax=Gordonia asplenii TaxID=2725283 RepID=A0A848KWQ2_9ACTN|nr:hypothetical protein [Gordonia asplenii]NMO03076.1 hypothetical protein [Gordonia asplenii]
MNVLAEMTRLSLARPASDAHPATISAWYAAKAQLHEYLATTDRLEHPRAVALCHSARARSAALLSVADQD